MSQSAAKKSKVKSTPARRTSQGQQKTRTIDALNVSDGALATIVGLAAHEVPGVVGMAPANFSEGIRRILGARQVDEGVVLERREGEPRDKATVDLHVVVAYGVNIPVVGDQIRKRVIYAAKRFAGVDLQAVRVHVDGVSRA